MMAAIKVKFSTFPPFYFVIIVPKMKYIPAIFQLPFAVFHYHLPIINFQIAVKLAFS
jgi:hypothetical protein